METLAAIQKELREIRETRERRAMPAMTTSQVTINGGGIGVIITSAAACFMLGVMLVQSVAYNGRLSAQQQEINRLEDYLSAIYMQAPHLKPPEKDAPE